VAFLVLARTHHSVLQTEKTVRELRHRLTTLKARIRECGRLRLEAARDFAYRLRLHGLCTSSHGLRTSLMEG
jgi:hypothetical protein